MGATWCRGHQERDIRRMSVYVPPDCLAGGCISRAVPIYGADLGTSTSTPQPPGPQSGERKPGSYNRRRPADHDHLIGRETFKRGELKREIAVKTYSGTTSAHRSAGPPEELEVPLHGWSGMLRVKFNAMELLRRVAEWSGSSGQPRAGARGCMAQ